VSRSKPKLIRTSPTREQCRQSREKSRSATPQPPKAQPIPTERLRLLAGRLHSLGPRSTYELLRELNRGAPLARLEAYAALDPGVVRALGADVLPPILRVIGPTKPRRPR
jgi:hypothetical protein